MDRIDPRASAATYLDFKGLGELRAQAGRDEEGALRATAQQFEALFVQTILQTMREASFKGGLFDSSTSETWQSMHDRELSVQMAKRGAFGVADMLVDQMSRRLQPPPAAQALADRARGLPLAPERAGLPLAADRPAFELKRPAASLPLQMKGQAMPLGRPTPVTKPEGGS